jgi:hypothetical protein
MRVRRALVAIGADERIVCERIVRIREAERTHADAIDWMIGDHALGSAPDAQAPRTRLVDGLLRTVQREQAALDARGESLRVVKRDQRHDDTDRACGSAPAGESQRCARFAPDARETRE